MDRQLAKGVLDFIERGRERPRERAARDAGEQTGKEANRRDHQVCSGNRGPLAKKKERAKPATAQATATGSKLRGRSSKSRSSTASMTAAIGVPKTAVIPATAPATNKVLRSPPVMRRYCPNSEPKAPPVMMIGPSAPKGPPLPIAMPEDRGLRSATLNDILLLPNKMASIASGMPCPRILSDPKRAINPIINPPTMGTGITHRPSVLWAGEFGAADQEWKKKMLVKSRMSWSRLYAATVLKTPTHAATAEIPSNLLSAAKSFLVSVSSTIIVHRWARERLHEWMRVLGDAMLRA